jgi:hypothetical protein
MASDRLEKLKKILQKKPKKKSTMSELMDEVRKQLGDTRHRRLTPMAPR